MFRDRFGITKLPAQFRREKLSISFDNVEGVSDPKQGGTQAVILYAPDANGSDHDHIFLTDKAVVQLRDWLNAYIDARGIKPTKGSEK